MGAFADAVDAAFADAPHPLTDRDTGRFAGPLAR